MKRAVTVAPSVFAKANERFREERSAAGRPSEYDFVAGPLAAAVFAFRDFDDLAYTVVATIRIYTVIDPFFGAVAFVARLLASSEVEIVDFSDDPDYWSTIDDEPE